MNWTLADLNPRMRAQAEAQLQARGTVRRHVCRDDPTMRERAAMTVRAGAMAGQIKPKRKYPYNRSTPDVLFGLQLKGEGIEFKQEHRFHPTRKWRFDYALTNHKVAVEIDGLLPGKGGRHQRVEGFTRDMVKLNSAVVLGWRVLRFSPRQVMRGIAIQTVREAIK